LQKPLVSVICLCYNHQAFVKRAIDSVLQQTYDNIELIVVDDASPDQSQKIILAASKADGFQTIFNEKNVGNCKSFNIGLTQSKGKYVIDLAADDVLLPTRIEIGVAQLEQKGETYGVHFCDANLIDKHGQTLGTHYKRDENGSLLENVPSGDIYVQLVEKYFICTPTMMMRRQVLEELNGYDEALRYEDFDFWVRSARNYKYAFSDEILVNKSMLGQSLSAVQHQKKNLHALSTAKVCEKILSMNKTDKENRALLKRVTYELKWALITENWEVSKKFIQIKNKISKLTARSVVEKTILRIKPPWFSLWKVILNLN